MVNTLAGAAALVKEVGLPSVQLVSDSYHQNIEEADPFLALADAASHLGHVQASDSNRLEPGAGHLDWPLWGATLRAMDYRGDIAVESRLSAPPDVALPATAAFLRKYL